ncbi:sulfatase-like hydrolase/transferase, partial [PVC group bacterium]|nr:sulfatase-like hydrolase/transferase [PVC group bacterium]
MANSRRLPPVFQGAAATLLACFVCAVIPAAVDFLSALRVFGLRWMPAGQIVVYGAIAVGVYMAFALLGAALGRIFWFAVAKTRLGGPRLKSLLTGAAIPAGAVCTLWAMASQDISLMPDILCCPTREVAVCYALCLVAGWAAATGVAYVLHELLKQFPRFRRVMGVSGLVVLGSALLALLGLAVWQHWPCIRSRSDRPNVLLITIDALRRDFPSCYGGHVHTPNIDRLAKEGTKFTSLSSCAPWTRPSCSSIHLGVYPSVHGVGGDGPGAAGEKAICFPTTLTTLAEAFQASGYSTQAFVSNSQVDRCFGFERGFDNYCMYEDISAQTPWLPIDEAGIPGRAIPRHALRRARSDFVDRPPRDDDKLRGLKR